MDCGSQRRLRDTVSEAWRTPLLRCVLQRSLLGIGPLDENIFARVMISALEVALPL
jgi:hypothetical protein